jgi:hypothetical protein
MARTKFDDAWEIVAISNEMSYRVPVDLHYSPVRIQIRESLRELYNNPTKTTNELTMDMINLHCITPELGILLKIGLDNPTEMLPTFRYIEDMFLKLGLVTRKII